MLDNQQIKEIIHKLKDYYPGRAEEAAQLLIEDYWMSLDMASSIMYVVRLLVQNESWYNWPAYNVQHQPFWLN